MFCVWRDGDTRDGDDRNPGLRTCKNCCNSYPLRAGYFKQQANSFQKTCKACLQEKSTAYKGQKRVALEELYPNQASRPRTAPITRAKETRLRATAPIISAKEIRLCTAALIAPAKETQYTRWDDSQQSQILLRPIKLPLLRRFIYQYQWPTGANGSYKANVVRERA